ncbi:MAG: hypothetical protein IKG18_18055 [Atopobiaceae bacterium]|nr:hypothetical protein [Atopobiaceae bacterium]
MQYCNVKVPLKMAYMWDENDIRDLLGALSAPPTSGRTHRPAAPRTGRTRRAT